MIKAIIFDYDGVIVDSLDQVVFRWNENSRIYGNGVKISKDFARASNTGSWRKFYTEALGIEPRKVEMASALFKELGLKQEPPPLFDGIADVIKSLSEKYSLYILSSHYSSVIKRDLQSHKFLDYFKGVAGYEESKGLTKPDPKLILNFLSEWVIEPENVIYVGDTSDEVECGKSAGVKTIACTWGFQSRDLIQKAKPDAIVNFPSEILNIISIF